MKDFLWPSEFGEKRRGEEEERMERKGSGEERKRKGLDERGKERRA